MPRPDPGRTTGTTRAFRTVRPRRTGAAPQTRAPSPFSFPLLRSRAVATPLDRRGRSSSRWERAASGRRGRHDDRSVVVRLSDICGPSWAFRTHRTVAGTSGGIVKNRFVRTRAVLTALTAWGVLAGSGVAAGATATDSGTPRLGRAVGVAPGVTSRAFDLVVGRGTAHGHLVTVDLTDRRTTVDLLYPGAVGAPLPGLPAGRRAGRGGRRQRGLLQRHRDPAPRRGGDRRPRGPGHRLRAAPEGGGARRAALRPGAAARHEHPRRHRRRLRPARPPGPAVPARHRADRRRRAAAEGPEPVPRCR
ncbi:hypothetical protein SRIMM317S_05639 [Streptomyces rimosus subsp. rimosus]